MRLIIKGLYILAIIVVIAGGLLFLRFVIGGDEDTWICVNSEWVKHGQPSAPKPAGVCDGV